MRGRGIFSREENIVRRSPFDIMAVILRTVRSGTKKKTHIMYEANLNWSQLNEYLNFMRDKGLIQYNDNGDVCITKKGVRFLEVYSKLIQILGS
ncbi:MAG: hypothetical protein DRJ66_06055 [Thermoprotei archaeon]|nr:MAG: hypothetical protein DRJ66_06055 [Thermoprotei archaeon]RLF18400.1 MAG: hypothetical protein DRZ82_08265 [Thermoprotei archaeon]